MCGDLDMSDGVQCNGKTETQDGQQECGAEQCQRQLGPSLMSVVVL